ncbi:hypothetical protein MKJ01_17215 [Chryseobacterium sp. SSA4.19]|uniref:DUF7674 family protein n=1 Tax=Chryseobacterium sp. SSA4.19 TaxID=2919915 RepID=UPI001F4E19B2|nr:hypothetical protein [Chryseobacterium sp. SSA4.19]MCJ8155501.1 hypothetical protein [Chryseobacterium sp. SSA4.19]
MNYLQATQEITVIIPEITDELKEVKAQNCYPVIEIFTDKIKNMIRQNDKTRLFRCLKKMNEIYRKGDTRMRNAIENSFIYSLDNCTAFCNKEYRTLIFGHLSQELQKVYAKQIYSHTI